MHSRTHSVELFPPVITYLKLLFTANLYIEENNIPENMNFLESGWYECDNVEHMDFCILDEYAKCIIEFPDGKKHEIKEIRYWDYDENFREVKEVYTGEGSGCYPKGYYFSCEANEKGTLFVLEIVLAILKFKVSSLLIFIKNLPLNSSP